MEKKLMRIGEFAQRFDIETDTIRYYVNKGILVPINKNDRYLFSDDDYEDLTFLLELKKMRFSLSDIHKILSLKRLSNLDDEDERLDYINVFQDQYAKVCGEVIELQKVKQQLLDEIKNASEHTSSNTVETGVPLTALPLLACPHCRNSLLLSDATIQGDQIIKGKLTCTCDYTARIKKGIIIGDQGRVSVYDGPDTNRACYRDMSPDLVTMLRRDYMWLLDKMQELPAGPKVVLEDFVNDYCFTHANIEDCDEDNLYIISDKFPEVVEMYKKLIDQKGLPHKVLYISAASYLLPLKDNCIDLYLDFASNECAIFNENYPFDFISRHLKSTSSAIGSFWHFDRGSESIKELKRQYPESWDKNFNLNYFMNYLKKHYNNIEDVTLIGTTNDSGTEDSFSYHVPEDQLSLTSYHVSGYRKDK